MLLNVFKVRKGAFKDINFRVYILYDWLKYKNIGEQSSKLTIQLYSIFTNYSQHAVEQPHSLQLTVAAPV